MNDKSRIPWHREILSHFGLYGIIFLLGAASFVAAFFYYDAALLDHRVEKLAYGVGCLVAFNVVVLIRLCRKSIM
jgi:hypothetical protein